MVALPGSPILLVLLPGRGPCEINSDARAHVSEEARALITEGQGNNHDARTILTDIAQNHPSVTLSQVQNILKSNDRKEIMACTIQSVKEYTLANNVNASSTDDKFPFFIGDTGLGSIGNGSQGRPFRARVTSKAWLRQLRDYQSTGRPLCLTADDTNYNCNCSNLLFFL